MSKMEKTLAKVLSGQQDASLSFDDLCHLLSKLGFTCRINGSHHNFHRDGFDRINLQPDGRTAKSYQVKQVRDTLKKGGL